jgi:hypothetical protein
LFTSLLEAKPSDDSIPQKKWNSAQFLQHLLLLFPMAITAKTATVSLATQ